VALIDRKDPDHQRVANAVRAEQGALVIPAPVTAEADYLIGKRVGRAAARTFLVDLALGRMAVDCLSRSDYSVLLALADQYADLNVGLTDLSVVVLAARYETRRILTLDDRHFRTLRPLQGGSFVLLPADQGVDS
jgi:predicted nucleic acid-binding protein